MKGYHKTYIGNKFRSIFLSATLAMVVEYVMALTDKIIVANVLNENALAALTLVEPFTLIFAFFAFILNGVTGVPFTSALGRGDKKKADQLISQSIFLAVVIGTVIMFIYIIFTDQLLQPLTENKEILSYVYDYFFNIRYLPISMLLNAVAYAFVIYRGGEKYCNISAVCSIISNIVLSILLCHVIGMKGISFGTLVGSIVGLIPMICFFFTEKGKTEFSFYFNLRELIGNMIYSLGEAMRYLYMAVLQLAVNRFLVSNFDVSAIVIFTCVTNLIGLFSAMVDGIEEFLLAMTGMYRGEENDKGCLETMRITIKAGIVEGALLTVGILLTAPWFSVIFGITDGALQEGIIEAVRIYAVSAAFYEILDIYSKYYLYTDKLKNSFGLSALQNLIVPLILSISLGMRFGLRGVWIGLSGAQMLLCLFLVLYARQKRTGKYGLFLDTDKMKLEWIWNVPMTEPGVKELTADITQVLEEQKVEKSRQKKVLQVIQTSQNKYIEGNPRAEKEQIECSLLIGNSAMVKSTAEKITLIIRNTGAVKNLLEDEDDVSYALVNGSNRFMLKV